MSVATMTPNTKELNDKRSKAYISAIMLMGIFTFVFLDCEYLFVNMISLSTVESKTVEAQNYS